MDKPDFDLAPLIDHSLLSPVATLEQLDHWCAEAERYQFASVCIYPVHVQRAVENLHNSSVSVGTVIGFPTGADTTAVKRYAAEAAADQGATELDVVINLGWLKAGQLDLVHSELAQIVEATGQCIKAILELNLLTHAEKLAAVEVCMDTGVQFLKTSTGWNGGATVEDVRLLREASQGRMGIKASGGIRTPDQAIALVEAGATRLGTSRGVEIVRQQAVSG